LTDAKLPSAEHVQSIYALTTAQKERDEAIAACAVMREVLEWIRKPIKEITDLNNLGGMTELFETRDKMIDKALSPTIGTDFLERMRSLEKFIQELADEDCSYGDNCPTSARHYRCLRCKSTTLLNERSK
jgi:hypothetical protein